jgi:SAM-dependent MidA family methyltransferase
LRGLILANEVADALPFRCFAVSAEGYQEWGAGMDSNGNVSWTARPASADLRLEITRLEDSIGQRFAVGYRSEVCMRTAPWVASLDSALAAGSILLFDYGLGRQELYHPQRQTGTLRCHYRHRAHEDPFLHPGLQDISAWVDFTRVAEAGSAAGLAVAGYCTQAAFLLGAGIEAELATERGALERARAASAARSLLMPSEMGETFKAMWLTRGSVPKLAAFGVQDLRRLL